MTKTDSEGRPYLKLADAKDNMVVFLDYGFTCHESGMVLLHGNGERSWFQCSGPGYKHYLAGQCDDGVHCVGVYPLRYDLKRIPKPEAHGDKR
jgi:hypothetical protein